MILLYLIVGALGVMFEYGIGVRPDRQAAFKCLKEAAARGNVYAQGNLAVLYFRRKLLNKAADVAKRYWTSLKRTVIISNNMESNSNSSTEGNTRKKLRRNSFNKGNVRNTHFPILLCCLEALRGGGEREGALKGSLV